MKDVSSKLNDLTKSVENLFDDPMEYEEIIEWAIIGFFIL